MSMKKKVSIERRSSSVVDQSIELLPQEPLNFTNTLPPTIQDSDHQVSDGCDSSSQMSFYTQYRTNVFFLKMLFMESQTTLSVTSSEREFQPTLKLVMGDLYTEIELAAIQRDIDNLLRDQCNSHVGNYYCEQNDSQLMPVFEVVFPSEDCLRKFLENQTDIEEHLANKLNERVLKKRKDTPSSAEFTVKFDLYLAVTSPASARRAILVNSNNCHLCMKTYFSSFTFSISELLQMKNFSPITEDELDDLISALYSVVDWFTLGLKFQVPVSELEKIQISHNANVNACKRDMLTHCVRQNELTWPGVVSTLCEMDYKQLALETATKYGIMSPVEVASQPQQEAVQTSVEVRKEEILIRDEEKEKELEKHIQELKKQIEQKQELDSLAKQQQEKLDESKNLIAKLEREKKELMKLQHTQVNLSTSLQESNLKLQEDIREKDRKLEEARTKCTKLDKELSKTKEKLSAKTAEVKQLQSTVKSLEDSLRSKKIKTSSTSEAMSHQESHENVNSSQGVETDSSKLNVTDADITSEIPATVSIRFIKPPSSYTTTGTEENTHFIVEGTGTSSDEMPNVSAQLKKQKDSSTTTAKIILEDDTQYEVVYTPNEGGIHMLDIYVNMNLASSQQITVYPNPYKLLLPVMTIPFSEAPWETGIDSQGRLWIAQSQCVSVVDYNSADSDTMPCLWPVVEQDGIVSVSVAEDDSVFVIAGHNLMKIHSKGKIKSCDMKDGKSWDCIIPPPRVQAHKDKVYVHFRDRSQIWVYDCNLKRRIGTINLSGNDIDIVFNRNEDVMYVLRSREIEVLSTKGEKKRSIQCPVSTPRNICVAGNYFYVAEDKQIIVLKMSGERVTAIKRHDVTQPHSLTVGYDGHIYICYRNAIIGDSLEGKVVVY